MANLVESTPVGAGPWFNRLAAGITLGLSLVLSSLGVPGVAVAQRAAEIQTGRWAVAGP
ncbi:MAG: hypothetical protein GWN85_20335, partial [Gemmatimonadetes bacterium]|nr:hypothetical protein [Gemmatimonadota bacterium]NIR38018.1 hypothetical protein [Actinomycetota bacterium]NIS32584.1 hypothetical protein [Actinomycetota bacterium]NIU65810.1 hypothetical protein [Actinomycetota bacterium]NIW29360.1 hypothetical protein [Actinomycetota bacterium]